MDLLIENIKGLVLAGDGPSQIVSGAEMSHLPVEQNAFLFIKDGIIDSFGPMSQKVVDRAEQVIDASGKFVFPSFVDSHTHLIFAGSRESEFVDRIRGLSYAEIAKKGGGILNSAKRLQNTAEDELYEAALSRLYQVVATGTGAIEIKSGYGLTTKDELKMLRVARRLKETSPVIIKTTFLGAHTIPKEVSREKYIDTVMNEMIPMVADQGLADYCDVFCEEGFFTPEESTAILEQGKNYGLKPKLHANQLHNSVVCRLEYAVRR
jgi:imidazolonepropionase